MLGSAVEVKVARRALLEPEPVMLRRVLEELRCLLEHVLGLGLVFGRIVGGGRRGSLVDARLLIGLEARLGDVLLNVELGRLLDLDLVLGPVAGSRLRRRRLGTAGRIVATGGSLRV